MSDSETSPVFTSLTRRFPEKERFCRLSAPCLLPSDRSVTARSTPSRASRLPVFRSRYRIRHSLIALFRTKRVPAAFSGADGAGLEPLAGCLLLDLAFAP